MPVHLSKLKKFKLKKTKFLLCRLLVVKIRSKETLFSFDREKILNEFYILKLNNNLDNLKEIKKFLENLEKVR
jgi:hypothetical protein